MGGLTEETKMDRLKRRDDNIIKRYDKLRSHKTHGVKTYTHESIVAKIAFEFYLSRSHVNNIINGYNRYQKAQEYQGKLF